MSNPDMIRDLEKWDERIREKVEEFGLDCFPQEFELCDHYSMLGYMAYSGMPSHYPHWSFGKSYERLKTLYDYSVTGLPYEMVINSNPCLAYLMKDNSFCLHILTVAHVYGHNDFFKKNFTFRETQPERTLDRFKVNADRVREYVEDPSIGHDRVEALLDAAHALAFQCQRNMAIRKRNRQEQKEMAWEQAAPPADPFESIHGRRSYEEPDLDKVPIEPEENVLLFVRDYNGNLAEWERDLLTIVHEQTQYFIPQIETKIMNEGWASFWHREIMNSLDLPPELQLEFLVHHNQVTAPSTRNINPYHLGLRIWDEIRQRQDAPGVDNRDWADPNKTGVERMFEIREVDRDVSFLRRFLTEDLMRELDLFEFEQKGDEYVVSKVADEQDWHDVKETLLRNVGMGSVPVIRIVDADYGYRRSLHLVHDHDGRDLHLQYAEKTLGYLYRLWGRKVLLETAVNGKSVMLSYGGQGFEVKELRS